MGVLQERERVKVILVVSGVPRSLPPVRRESGVWLLCPIVLTKYQNINTVSMNTVRMYS